MSGLPQGPRNPNFRAAFLVALEYGVSPIARADYTRVPSTYTPEEDCTDASHSAEAYERHLATKRPTRRLVVSAADILAEMEEAT